MPDRVVRLGIRRLLKARLTELGDADAETTAAETDGAVTSAEAEGVALQTTCERAGLVDGQRMLELGCGLGSLAIWMAER